VLTDFRFRFRAIFLRNTVEAELDDELRFHLEHQLEKYRRAGLSEKEAARRIRLEFGGTEQVREECRDARGTRWVEDAIQDLRHAARSVRKYPVFAAALVITVALGVGASTAIFSVADAVLLRPLPYPDASRLVLAVRDMPLRNIRDYPMSSADYLDVHDELSGAFEDSAAAEASTQDIVLPRSDGTPDQVRIETVTPNFLRLLGAPIYLGRDFAATDGQPGAAETAIISYEFWQRHDHGDPSILGRPIRERGAVVHGILAPGFELLLPPSYNLTRAPDIWIAAPLNMESAPRTVGHLRAIAKLRVGVGIEQAQARANTVAAEFERKFPVKKGSGVAIRLEPMQRYLVAEIRPAILALLGAALALLLIACANGANLMLVRTSLRDREFAVRASLGGSWLRILRQTATEGALLSALGILLGLGGAFLGIHELQAIAPNNPGLASLPRLNLVSLDGRVLAFAALIGLLATVTLGLVPAIRVRGRDLAQALRASGLAPDSWTGVRFRNAVVTAEIALSCVLLVASGLLFRSFLALQRVDPGYDPRGILTFRLTGFRGTPAEHAAYVREVQRRLAGLPGIHAVTAARSLPLNGVFYALRWGGEAALADPKKSADFQVVQPGYFETLRTPLIAGRTFTAEDNAPGKNVAVIDDQFATKAFPHESAIGKSILVSVRAPNPEWVRIIGVVAHQRDTSLAKSGREQIYLTSGFLPNPLLEQWAVQIDGDPASYSDEIRAEVTKLSHNLLVSEMQPMETFVVRAQSGTRFSLLLLAVFGAVAVLLAGVGLYGVLSTVVQQRTTEIGIRIVLGAAPTGIFRLVVGKGLLLSAIGIALGLGIAAALTPALDAMLVGVKPLDPATFAAVAVFFLGLAAFASWLPARRAAGVHPADALREQ
jgi:putative ABC transport system permease protein